MQVHTLIYIWMSRRDLEYAYALRAEAEAVRRGEIKTRRLDEIAASLGLDD